MNFKNLLKKVSVAVFSGVMALSVPMTTASALTHGQEYRFITKYSNIIQENSTSIMHDLLHQMLVTTTGDDIFNAQEHLDVVDYGNLLDIINNNFVDDSDSLHFRWTPYAIIDAATARFPQVLRSAIICDYCDTSNSAPAYQETEILHSFLRISASVRAGLIQWMNNSGIA